MSELDCELTRLRVDKEMKQAIYEAARRQGISPSAWRKVAYAKVLTEQLGAWRRVTTTTEIHDQKTAS